ncbi:hypothetical protein [Spirillospora sp. NPDC047279]|uniref:hypothetical protein n=1 Tax=Spirillospora sp. NPDC047279 TaxID=3155478 RepID=UPI003400F13F
MRTVAVTADVKPLPTDPPDPVIEGEPAEEKGEFGARDETIVDSVPACCCRTRAC